MSEPFLTMTGISKAYPGVRAAGRRQPCRAAGRGGRPGRRERRRQVDPDEDPRRRRRADRGEIELDGVDHAAAHRRDGSMRGGIAFVHQELNLFDNLTAAANIFIGREPLTRRAAQADRPARRWRPRAKPLLQQLGADFRSEQPVAALSLAAKAAGRDRQGAVAEGPARHHGRADLQPHRDRDGAAAQRHRPAQGRRRQRDLHLAPPGRGRALRPTAWWCCATAAPVAELGNGRRSTPRR